jgi:hypothetical protein
MTALRQPLTLTLVAALLSAAACSDTTAPNGSLTADEISELAVQMGQHFASAFSGSAALASKGQAQSSAIPATIKVNVNLDVPCPRGGTSHVAAMVDAVVDDATESVTADVTGSQALNDCGFDLKGKDVGAKTIWVTGTLRSTAHAQVVNGLPVGEQRASLDGSFSWRASDGRRGSCDVNYAANADYTTNVATVNGNFCGQTIQVTAPLAD